MSKLLARLGAPALAILVLAGCGSSNNSSSTGSTSSTTSSTASSSEVASVAAQVPAAIKSKGTLNVASEAEYAPNEFIAPDGHTIIGMDPDLVTALGEVMGLKVKFINANFETIIPGLAAGRYDLGASSFTDTKEREKTVDFVDYYSAGISFYAKSSANPGVEELKTVLSFPGQNAVNLAVSSGRAELGMADSPVVAYQIKQSNGQFKLIGKSYAFAPYGLAIPKTSGMTKPILAALKELISSGKYKQILEKWGIASGAITEPKINGAIS
jgi:polar amino acid transport system substrate-binding protein